MLVQSISGLTIEASANSADGILDQFYRDYDAAFVLPNEKEGRDGFATCLALNAPPAYASLAARFGPFREFMIIARDVPEGPRIGGANLLAFPLQQPEAGGAILAVHLSYVFINAAAQRKGYFKRLVQDLPDIALRLLIEASAAELPREWPPAAGRRPTARPATLIFIEQNDPYRMSRADYDTDTRYTGLDQITRIAMWSRLGARIVDFAYVQPPLSPGQGPDHNLVLAVLGATGDRLSACLLGGHLERFFGISVLKGADPLLQPTAAQQLLPLRQLCAERGSVPLLAAPMSVSEFSTTIPGPRSLRDFLRN